jgi:hypothetical protein
VPKPRKPRQLRLNVYRGSGGEPPKLPSGELLLEYFSDHEVLAWRAKSKDVQQYHYLWYFELEAQRAAHQQQILDALRSVPGIAMDLSNWGRAMPYKYSATPLSCVGSLKWVGGRFNYGVDIDSTRFAPFPALYLAEDMETGLREMQGLTREDTRGGLNPSELNFCAVNGIAWVAVAGNVSNIFDLTHPGTLQGFASILSKFKLSKAVRDAENKLGAVPLRLVATADELHNSFMLENWREYPSVVNTPANSQLFGHLLSVAGFEGALFSSTRTGKGNLVLFTRQFKNSASLVRVLNPPTNARCCELSALTYKGLEFGS